MNLDAQDETFMKKLEVWLAGLSNDLVRSFDKVVSESPGYYPTTLHGAWAQEVGRRGLDPEDSPQTLGEVVGLPVGHALDFDWRFAEQTRADLLAEIGRLTSTGDTVAFLGTPTIFVESIAALPDRGRVLIDANAAMVDHLQNRLGKSAARHVRIGVDGAPADIRAQLCVLDPPWYPEDTRQFLEVASSLVSVGDPILLSQPPLSARPGVAAERVVLEKELPKLGLRLNRVASSELSYQTPHFERMSLMAAAPTLRIPEDWRRGDLFYLEKVAEPEVRPASGRPVETWIEARFGPVRIRIRDAGGPDLALIAPDIDRLLTVSRRDPLRGEVGFWTSGNRVRACGNARTIAELIALCDSSLNSLNFTHATVVRLAGQIGVEARVAHELAELLLLEYQEHIAGGYGVVE